MSALTPQEEDAARARLLRYSLDRLIEGELADEIRLLKIERAYYESRIVAREFGEEGIEAIQNSVALVNHELDERYRRVARWERLARRPEAYAPLPEMADRFFRARHADFLAIFSGLTGHEVTPTRDGGGYARCPFHDDDTPSFKIYPPGRGAHCFGCGFNGTTIDFVMRYSARRGQQPFTAVEALLFIETEYL